MALASFGDNDGRRGRFARAFYGLRRGLWRRTKGECETQAKDAQRGFLGHYGGFLRRGCDTPVKQPPDCARKRAEMRQKTAKWRKG